MRNGADIVDHMRAVYQKYDRPWIVSVSGGKDSTAVLQLVYQMLRGIPTEDQRRQVYVLSGDPLVESPLSAERIRYLMGAIQDAAARDQLSLSTKIIMPPIDKTYWVTVIGKGLSPPTWRMQWCTTQLKIVPMMRYVTRNIAPNGEVLWLMGSRIYESARRGASMRKYGLGDGDHISEHGKQKNALIYAPIAEWSDADVYAYLRSTRSPWGDDNNAYLDTFYGAGSEGYLPGCDGALRIDSRCLGKIGRTGCWVCTVAARDWSLERYIAAGNTALKPLLAYRQLLQHVCHDMTTRMLHSVTGRPSYITPEWRAELLDQLLALRTEHPDLDAWCTEHNYQLIRPDEIAEIRRLWAGQGILEGKGGEKW